MISPAPSAHLNRDAIAPTPPRRTELDWLRVLIIVGLIPFHVVGLFAVAIVSYVQGEPTSQVLTIFSEFFGLWPMSLLFLVAGAGTWFALGRRTARQYVGERLLRLFVPFLFATLVIIPIQVYAIVSVYPQLIGIGIIPDVGLHGDESFITFYPVYLKGYAYFLTHFSIVRETVFWGHLWFIPRLLLYALATLPLLLWLRSEGGMRFIERLSRLFDWPGSTLLLGLAIATPRILAAAWFQLSGRSFPDASWGTYELWAQLGVFMMCFVLGYLIYASPRLLRTLQRDGSAALAIGIIGYILLQTPLGHLASVTEITPGGILMIFLRAESEWLLVAGVLSVGLRFLTVSNALLVYLNEAAYPLYVLHMPVLILVGLTVTQGELSRIVTLPTIVLATLALTLGIYEFAIKRVPVLRLLFGLKPKPSHTTKARHHMAM